jgi:hypothetical protein
MRTRCRFRSFLSLPVVLAAVAAATASAGATGSAAFSPATGPVPAVVQRFLDRREEPLTSYRALRRLQAQNVRYKKDGWIDAWTTLDAEKGFRYEIAAEGGSSYIRDKVLRKTLEREAEAHARVETKSAALAPLNYTFADEGTGSDGLVGIGIEPLRKEAMLLRGRMFLTSDGADLVRVEGQLVKNPSFWTRRVDIVRRYERIDGVRVPVATESIAQVMIAGRSTFAMVYEYASINGRTVGQPQPRASGLPAPRER